MSKFREQIAVNLTGQLQVIQAFAPCLGAGEQNRSGPARTHVVNISSVAGRFAAPFLGPIARQNSALKRCQTP